MKKRISLFFAYFLFWYLFFVACKIIFLVYELPLTKTLSFIDILKVLIYGSKMDLAVAGYFTVIPGLLFIFTAFFKGRILARILTIYTGILIFAAGFLVVADMELYRFWGFRLDTTPLMYLKNPKEAAGSANLWVSVVLIIGWIIFCWFILKLYLNIIGKKIKALDKGDWKQALAIVPLTACLLIPIRGSFGVAPMNIGFVYFHKSSTFANHAAINVVWNVGYALSTYTRFYPNTYFDREEAESIFKDNYKDNGQTQFLLNIERPNILVLIIESFTNKIIEPLGGMKGITPNFNELCREGILFTNCYANGDRTDKGIISVLNGYPGHPKDAIINYPKKTESLPYLNTDLKRTGYYTEFVYGYDIDYANFRSYFTNARYDKVVTKADFDPSIQTSKWGVHDHYVFDKLLEECNAAPTKPFFIAFASQSSHEPFQVPMKTVIHGTDEENMFLNSAYYADSAIGDFIRKAKKTEWWKNTLIVFVSDHGSRHPGKSEYNAIEKYHIPMLWIGGAIAKKDTIVSTYFSQSDFPLTLLRQLKVENNRHYKFSRNFMSSQAPDFAFYVYNDGFVILEKGTFVMFDNVAKRPVNSKGANIEPLLKKGKAHMQVLSTDFGER
jgi:phosphoglycerol transferase MdoB-like AlkP superfamily enzyme